MAISPTAPDYVSQVRGILGDLRDNYLKKQQLYLQGKDQEDRLNLSYAQLGVSSRNAAQQVQLEQDKIQAASNAAQAQLSSSYAGAAGAALKAQSKNDLEERKFELEQFKELNKLQQEQGERDKEVASGRLMQSGLVALNSDDPTKLIEWTNLMAGSILNQKQRNDVFNNALALVDAKKRLEIDGNNLKTQPKAIEIIQKLNMFNVSEYSPDQLASALTKTTDEFKALKNTDPKINDAFMSVSQDVAKRQNEYLQQDYGKAFGSFLNDATIGQLDPVDQKAWDDLQKQYPGNEVRNSSADYSDKSKRLMFQSNKRKSIEEIARMEKSNQVRVENLAAKNSALSVIKTDPETGQQYKSFIVPAPDLTPRVGYNGAIDPNTGLLTKRILDENKKFVDEITSPSFVFGGSPLQMMISEMSGQGAFPATKTTPQTRPPETAAIPFRSNSNTSFDSVDVPGTAKVATVPTATAPEISPETINNIVTAYRSNPETIIYGRPAREIIAVLKSKGYSIPDVLASPQQTR